MPSASIAFFSRLAEKPRLSFSLRSRRLTSRWAYAALSAVLASAMAVGVTHAATVQTAFGEVEVGDSPQRVVTLYEGALDAALSVGVTPLGAVTTRGGNGVAAYLDTHLEAIDIVGVVREINLEAVLAQQPDLILGPPRLSREQYALLSKIAPTVVPPTQGFTADAWKEETRLFGRALSRETQADAAIEALEQRAAMLASVTTTELGDRNGAVLVRWMPQGPMVMSDQLFASGLMRAAGLEVHTASLVAEGYSHSDSLSLENLARIDDDWIFLATLNADGREALEAARSSPAFERLESVQKEQVVAVDGQLWTSASGPLAAHAILDDLENALLP